MVKAENIFPAILIILDVCAAGVYISGGDIRLFVYWLSSAVLTASVTF